MPTPTYLAPALADEPLLLRTLTRVCRQHGATDATTRRLLRAVVADVRHLTYRNSVIAALRDYHHSEDPDVDDLDTLTTFVAGVLEAEDRPAAAPTEHPGPSELAPDIYDAIATVMGEIWEREKDDYDQQDDDGRADHPFRALLTLHTWLGPLSPVR